MRESPEASDLAFVVPVFTPARCDGLLAALCARPLRPGMVRRGDGAHTRDGALRQCAIGPLDDRELRVELFLKLLAINRQEFGFATLFFEADDPVQVIRYQEGGHFGWHQDVGGTGTPAHTRVLGFTLQLSPSGAYEGGDLVFRGWSSSSEPALRQQGTLITFPARRLHCVTEVVRGERWAIVGWLHSEPTSLDARPGHGER